jgi:hypothetical protein
MTCPCSALTVEGNLSRGCSNADRSPGPGQQPCADVSVSTRCGVLAIAIAVVPLLTDRFVAYGDGKSDKAIAVLLFVDMSGEPNQAYFGDGIAEELLNLLTKIPDLRVISRSSAFSFKDKAVDVSEIARRLNVAHVFEGSVCKAPTSPGAFAPTFAQTRGSTSGRSGIPMRPSRTRSGRPTRVS